MAYETKVILKLLADAILNAESLEEAYVSVTITKKVRPIIAGADFLS